MLPATVRYNAAQRRCRAADFLNHLCKGKQNAGFLYCTPPPPHNQSEIISASAVRAGKEHGRSVGRLAKSGVYVLGAFMALALAAGQANGAQDAQAIQVAQAGRLDSATQKKLNDALLEAAKKGNTAEVQRLLDSGADVEAREEDGDSALSNAACCGNTDTVRLLVEKGADVNAVYKNGWTALMMAAQSQNTDTVRLLIEKGADVNARRANGDTPLLKAAGHSATARLLVEKGADVNAKDDGGWTVLMGAAHSGQTDFVRFLIDEKGVDVNAKMKDGTTVLMHAAAEGETDTARLLIEKGADINAKDKNGITALDKANRKGHIETARMLRQKGARGRSLDELLFHGSYVYISGLVKSGANINAKNSDGETALIVAVRNGDESKVSELLEHGASVNAKATGGSYKGWTARDIAEYNGNSSIAQLLASKGGKTTGAVQAKRKREEAESRRAAAERERRNKEACSRVYVGKSFIRTGTLRQTKLDRLLGVREQTVEARYEVRGFSPVTGEVSAVCVGGSCSILGYDITTDCFAVR